ncbi:MAG: DNA-directed RNA polymerase subunit alpha C-terminal domain-containing protein, partial [Planctomycetota bacterium]
DCLLRTPIEDYEDCASSMEAPKIVAATPVERDSEDQLAPIHPESNAELAAAQEKLKLIFEGYAKRGIAFEARRQANGVMALVIVRHDEVDVANDLAANRVIPRLVADLAGEEHESKLDRPIGDLDLPLGAIAGLGVIGVRTIGQLVRRDSTELLAVDDIDQSSLRSIRHELASLGLRLRDETKG